MRARIVTLAMLITILCSSQATAGAWTQNQGKGLLATSATYYHSDEFFDNLGNLRDQSSYQKHEVSTYAEWGARDYLTIGANLFANHTQQSGKENYSLSDAELFARVRLWHDDTRVISIQPLIKLPTAAYKGTGPQSGSESTDAEFAILYGESFHFLSNRDFLDASASLRTRDNGLSSQWKTSSKYAVGLTDALMLISAIHITQSLNLELPQNFSEGGDIDYNLTKAELTLLYQPDNNNGYWTLSSFKHIAGTQAGAGYGISLTQGIRF